MLIFTDIFSSDLLELGVVGYRKDEPLTPPKSPKECILSFKFLLPFYLEVYIGLSTLNPFKIALIKIDVGISNVITIASLFNNSLLKLPCLLSLVLVPQGHS